MSSRFNRRNLIISAAVAMAIAVPTSFSFASETSLAASISDAFPAVEPQAGSGNLIEDAPGEAVDAPIVALAPPAPSIDDAVEDTRIAANDAELECMAKVVHHESANQPREGQLAVAQLIMNRLESGRFPDTVCAVVNQPGQFFKTASYNPRRDSGTWKVAMDVSREAMAGVTADVVPGALFYHAAYQAPNRFFRTRTRAGVLGDHIFYR